MLTLYQFKLDIDKNKMKNMSTHWFVLAALLLTSLALTRRNEASAQSLGKQQSIRQYNLIVSG